jgi:predicted lipoprotein with Yx(FWY)xxD motif
MSLAPACAPDRSVVETPMEPAAGAVRPDARPRVPAPAVIEPAALGARHTAPYGTHLVDRFGRSVYAFAADTRGARSTCHEACARAWPPVLSAGTPRAVSDEVKSSKFGTIERADGATQATYDGWPLYHYARDRLPGEALGHGVSEFGAEWYLLSPNGDWIEDDDGAAAPPAKSDPTTAPPPFSDVPVPPDYPAEE